MKAMNEHNVLFSKNLLNPVLKDTIRVPRFGAVSLRFIANNPGNVVYFLICVRHCPMRHSGAVYRYYFP